MEKKTAPHCEQFYGRTSIDQDGGAEGIRTPDPHNAIVVLYQLSYDPIRSGAETVKVGHSFVKIYFPTANDARALER